MHVEHERQVGGERHLEGRRRQLVQRERQADPGIWLRVGGASDLIAIRLNRRARLLAHQEPVSLAERERSVGAQFAVPSGRQVAHVQQTAPYCSADLPGFLLNPGIGLHLVCEGLTPLVGGRNARHPGGVDRHMPDLPGQPVVKRNLAGDLLRVDG